MGKSETAVGLEPSTNFKPNNDPVAGLAQRLDRRHDLLTLSQEQILVAKRLYGCVVCAIPDNSTAETEHI